MTLHFIRYEATVTPSGNVTDLKQNKQVALVELKAESNSRIWLSDLMDCRDDRGVTLQERISEDERKILSRQDPTIELGRLTENNLVLDVKGDTQKSKVHIDIRIIPAGNRLRCIYEIPSHK